MEDFSKLYSYLWKLGEAGKDPVFHAFKVTEKIVARQLDREAWLALLSTFQQNQAPVVSLGIIGALIKEGDRESSNLRLAEMLPFLETRDWSHRSTGNQVLCAVRRRLIREDMDDVEDDTLLKVTLILSAISSSEHATQNTGTIVDILWDLVFGLREVGRVLPEEAKSQVEEMLRSRLCELPLVYEESRSEVMIELGIRSQSSVDED